jgi:hypothetical protein
VVKAIEVVGRCTDTFPCFSKGGATFIGKGRAAPENTAPPSSGSARFINGYLDLLSFLLFQDSAGGYALLRYPGTLMFLIGFVMAAYLGI